MGQKREFCIKSAKIIRIAIAEGGRLFYTEGKEEANEYDTKDHCLYRL